jgi:hypothetical protein
MTDKKWLVLEASFLVGLLLGCVAMYFFNVYQMQRTVRLERFLYNDKVYVVQEQAIDATKAR